MRALVMALALVACSPPAPIARSEPDPEPGPPQELVESLPGSNWVMNDEALNIAPTVDFGMNGEASGSTGCNRWQGRYQTDGMVLSFGDVVATEMACGAPASETEEHMLRVLAETEGVRTENGEIMFDNLAGEELARFHRLR